MILPPWAYAAAAALTFGVGFTVAWKVQSWKCDAAVAKGMRDAAKKTAELMQQAHESSTAYEGERNETVVQVNRDTRTIREIYLDRVVPGACAVDDTARGVLESGVNRANSAASGEPRVPMPSRSVITEPTD